MRHCLRVSAFVVAASSLLIAEIPPPQHITVQQLEAIVSAQHNAPDKKAAQRLDGLILSERLSASSFAQLNDTLPGPDSRQRLHVIADAAEFLDLPSQDILHDPQPDKDTQVKILARAADFVATVAKKMPNFSAARTTVRYRDYTPAFHPFPIIVTPGKYHLVDDARASVRYENGKEEAALVYVKKAGIADIPAAGATNLGLFGPLLGIVMADGLRSTMAWSHWEQGSAGPLAVFRFYVPKKNSRYSLQYCCAPGKNAVSFQPPYRGAISIDPETGAVLRLAVEANVQSTGVFSRADVLVEYGEVPIGPKKYICPLRSTSVTTEVLYDRLSGYITADDYVSPVLDPRKVTWINDTTFSDYHVFASEIRILPDGGNTP